VADHLKSDLDVVLAAVANDGFAVEFACPDLSKDNLVMDKILEK